MQLAGTTVPSRDSEVGRLARGMQAKPDSITNAIKVNCGRNAASCDRRHGVRTRSVQTLFASLRISPGLAATGSREIQPVSWALLRARADAVTGIKRADTANEKQFECPAIRCAMATPIGAYCVDRSASTMTIAPLHKFIRSKKLHASLRLSFVIEGTNVGARGMSAANDLARQRLTRTAYPPPRVACVRGAARATVDKTFSVLGCRIRSSVKRGCGPANLPALSFLRVGRAPLNSP